MLPTRFILSSLRCNGILGLRFTCDLPFTSYIYAQDMAFLLACSHSDDHLLSNRRLPNWKSGIPLPIFSEWWLFNDKFSAIDSFVLSSFPGAMFQGMNGLSVKYQVLDLVLGHGDDLFRLAQSKALVSIHDHEAVKGGELTHDNDYSGALDLTEKTAKEAMTPIE